MNLYIRVTGTDVVTCVHNLNVLIQEGYFKDIDKGEDYVYDGAINDVGDEFDYIIAFGHQHPFVEED